MTMTKSAERGFTLVEFMIAMLITTAVLGGTVALATQVQQSYTSQLDDSAVEQEVRYALDWIARYLRSAGSNPYSCVVFEAIQIDPNANGENEDVEVQADINPPDGDCTGSEEDVTIAFNEDDNTITLDTGGGPVAMTDPIITGLEFTYLDETHNPTTLDAQVAYVGIEVTARSEGRNAATDSFDTASGTKLFSEFTLSTEVRLRIR